MSKQEIIVPTEKAQQVAKVPEPASASADRTYDLIRFAIEKGATPETLGKLFDLQERAEKMLAERKAEAARDAFNRAMAAFKAMPLKIVKNKHVGFTSRRTQSETEYWHATLDHVCAAINPNLAQHGLSFYWEPVQDDKGKIAVTCVVAHVDGHSQRTTLYGQPDESGNKNKIQSVGSTVTYLQRYTLMSALGLATADQDNDGAEDDDQDKVPITAEQIAEIQIALDEIGQSAKPLCEYFKVDSLADFYKSEMPKVMAEIDAAKKRFAEKKK